MEHNNGEKQEFGQDPSDGERTQKEQKELPLRREHRKERNDWCLLQFKGTQSSLQELALFAMEQNTIIPFRQKGHLFSRPAQHVVSLCSTDLPCGVHPSTLATRLNILLIPVLFCPSQAIHTHCCGIQLRQDYFFKSRTLKMVKV